MGLGVLRSCNKKAQTEKKTKIEKCNKQRNLIYTWVYTWACKDQTSSKYLIKIVEIRIIELNDAVVNYMTTLSKKIKKLEHLSMDLYNGDMELKEIQTLEGHTDRVWSLVWNPATGTSNIPPVFA